MPAYHDAEVACELPVSDAKRRLRTAAESLGWPLLEEKDAELVFRAPFNLFSYGENVTANLQGRVLRLHSKCRLPTQIFDAGQNRRNCVKLLRAAGLGP